MTDQSAGRKAAPTRKLKKEQSVPAPSTPQSEAQGGSSRRLVVPALGRAWKKPYRSFRGYKNCCFLAI
jgi:hypothetical protein